MSRSGFYAWLTRPRSRRSLEDQRLTELARRSFLDSDRTYGARRVWRDVLASGERCGLHRVERLMRAQALRARPSAVDCRSTRSTSNGCASRQRAGSAVRRPGAEPEMGRRLHIPLDGGRLVLRGGSAGPVLAARSRLVDAGQHDCATGHRCVDDGAVATWTSAGLAAPFRSRQPIQQRAVPAFARRTWHHLQHEPRRQRLGQLGDGELLLHAEDGADRAQNYRTRDEAKADVFDYIERFYNPKRQHSTIGYISPIQFEQQMQAT